MIKGAIFDMDGVLVDNIRIHIKAFEEMCRIYNVPFDAVRLNNMAGRGNDEIIPAFFPEAIVKEKGVAALSAEKEAVYRNLYTNEIEEVAGLTSFLAALKASGVRCAVGSSGCQENIDFVLDSCKLRPYFDVIVSSDLVTHCKPDPEIYLTALRKLDLPAESCVVFEDAPAGIEAARRAGIEVIALATTHTAEELQKKGIKEMIINDFRNLSPACFNKR